MSKSKEYFTLLNFVFWYLKTLSPQKHCFTKMSISLLIMVGFIKFKLFLKAQYLLYLKFCKFRKNREICEIKSHAKFCWFIAFQMLCMAHPKFEKVRTWPTLCLTLKSCPLSSTHCFLFQNSYLHYIQDKAPSLMIIVQPGLYNPPCTVLKKRNIPPRNRARIFP